MKNQANTNAWTARSRRITITTTCLLAVLASAYSLAEKPTIPQPGQRVQRNTGPAHEAARAKPVPSKPNQPALTPGEVVEDPAEGGIVRLRDVAASPAPSRSAMPRSHVQGEGADARSEAAPVGMPLFPKAATNAASTPPAGSGQRDAGDNLRQIDGVDDTESTWIPPDMVLATGPAHVVEAVNSGFSVYTKLGTRVELGPDDVSYWTFNNFFDGNKPAGWAGFMFDPRIVYDPLRDRFVMLVLGRDDVNQESYIFIALSQTSDPTAGWCTRRIYATDTGGTSAAWLDYAGVGVDTWGLYVTGNYFYWSGGKRGAQIRSFDTDIFDDCTQSLVSVKFPNVQWPSGGQADSLQPAHPHTVNGAEETFFVATYSSSGNKVLLAKLSGNRTSSPTLTKVEIDIPAYNAIGANVDQPGSSTDIDGGKSKVQNAVYSNRRVFFSLTDDVNNDGSSSGWLTVKLNTDLNTKEWHHLLWSGTGFYYFYPALTLQGSGVDNNLAIFGSWTDAETTTTASTLFPSGLFKIYENQPNDPSGPFVGTATGAASYVKLDMNSRNRWGDYSGASYDWTCGNAWGVVESAATGNQWKTTLVAREFANEGPCPLMEVVDPVENADWTSGSVQTVRWLSDGLPATDEIYIYVFSESGILTVVEGLPTTYTSYNWEIPEVPAEGALLSIGSWDGSAYSAIAWSQPFNIVDATAPSPDPLGWTMRPTPLGPSEITMAATPATDGSGSAVEYDFEFVSSPTGGSGGSDSGWIASNAFNDSGLGPNQEYCYLARARDETLNTTDDSATECNYTLAAAPVPAAFSEITGTSVRVNWGAGGNPGNTEYLVEGQPGNLNSGAVTELSRTVSGLAEATTYSFRVKARNANNVQTAWVDLGTVTTLADDPDGDGVVAAVDNCLAARNAAQRDTDGDGFGNVCDQDIAPQSNDCIVNPTDLGTLRAAFLSTPGDANWNPDADFNGDNIVNPADLGRMHLAFLGAPGPSGVPNDCD